MLSNNLTITSQIAQLTFEDQFEQEDTSANKFVDGTQSNKTHVIYHSNVKKFTAWVGKNHSKLIHQHNDGKRNFHMVPVIIHMIRSFIEHVSVKCGDSKDVPADGSYVNFQYE
jgi:hypothetical protein